MSGVPGSQVPLDQLIGELIQTGRAVTEDEVAQIIERLATAPFDLRVVPVKTPHRGLHYLRRALSAREDSLFYHLVQRVIVDGQWAVGTSAPEYLDDLQRAIRSDLARLAVYARRGGHVAATVTPTAHVLPARKCGWRPLPGLIVVYSADRGIILSGYQFSDMEQTGIPAEARWLR